MNTMRDQLQMYGASELSTLDLLTLVLAPQAKPEHVSRLARLLSAYDLRRLRQAGIPELRQMGLSTSQAERLTAICELTHRLTILETPPLPEIRCSRDAERLLRPLMAHLDHEVMRVLVLNNKNMVVENIELYRGTVCSAATRIAEILRPVLLRKGSALLIAHFHPSGDPTPSIEDLELTEALREAAHIMDIELVDHLIIGNPTYVSLRSKMGWQPPSALPEQKAA